eukprot:CAMPEP_0206829496 /NCGR_PEP_ID=MMETSP0975-20121206/16395_1 /ASSEMBLY_ACC=CAM_ASM_000399 /TAXON_ID=483370 /ORGANISM="non described non described, Strain CCMP2097" /LENGTH=183 /DNA_ID=CAMNT_0054371835 /DNA_START=88 /DNA_END=640 /DNA_ORIENTATION=-
MDTALGRVRVAGVARVLDVVRRHGQPLALLALGPRAERRVSPQRREAPPRDEVVLLAVEPAAHDGRAAARASAPDLSGYGVANAPFSMSSDRHRLDFHFKRSGSARSLACLAVVAPSTSATKRPLPAGASSVRTFFASSHAAYASALFCRLLAPSALLSACAALAAAWWAARWSSLRARQESK